MASTFNTELLRDLKSRLEAANHTFARDYPGETPNRQPVHTVYGGAHLFKAGTAVKFGELAMRSVGAYAPDFTTLARAMKMPGHQSLPTEASAIAALTEVVKAGGEASPAANLAWNVYSRVIDKLEREALEDFRIDFEDGYGNRPDAEEDNQARVAAEQVAAGMAQGTLSPFIGIRIKPLNAELMNRSIQTLDIFVTTLSELTGGELPGGFVVTLPKVTIAEQVTALVDLFEVLEAKTALAKGSLRMEIMIEQTQAIVGSDGVVALPALVRAARGRCTACHFGTYDYTASCTITAAYQEMQHPACDFATHMMQVALGGTGVWLSDGATTVMPVAPNRAPKGGPPLSEAQQQQNVDVVHRAWQLAYDNTMHSLKRGIYQGWDLHPAQLVARYAAVYTFFLESLDAASVRLKAFMAKAAQATLVGDVFDDAATGQGLLNYFLRALNSGAITVDEVTATGLSMDELHTRSFVKILDGRKLLED